MDTIITTTVRETLRSLPVDGAERDRLLRYAAEVCAERQAASALDLAVRRSDTAGADAAVLQAAHLVLQNPSGAAAARDTLRRGIASGELFDASAGWMTELRSIAASSPGSGACTIASALQLWLWTAHYFLRRADRPESVMGELAESFASLAAARCQIIATVRPFVRSSTPQDLLLDLCHVQAARTAGRVGTLCAELVHGYRRHPGWDAEGCTLCYGADELDELEGLMPGFASAARAQGDVIEADGSHASKAGPCVRFNQIEGFTRLRAKLDGCLTGARLAGDRAAAALAGTLAPAGH